MTNVSTEREPELNGTRTVKLRRRLVGLAAAAVGGLVLAGLMVAVLFLPLALQPRGVTPKDAYARSRAAEATAAASAQTLEKTAIVPGDHAIETSGGDEGCEAGPGPPGSAGGWNVSYSVSCTYRHEAYFGGPSTRAQDAQRLNTALVKAGFRTDDDSALLATNLPGSTEIVPVSMTRVADGAQATISMTTREDNSRYTSDFADNFASDSSLSQVYGVSVTITYFSGATCTNCSGSWTAP